MSDQIELMGEWWLPDNPDSKLYGTLKYDQKKIELIIMGQLKKTEGFSSKVDNSVEVIQGFTTNGKRVSLIDCIRVGHKFNIPGTFTEKYSPELLFIGTHFNTKENIAFTSVKISYQNLEQWLSPSSYAVSYNDDEKSMIIEYSLPKSIKANFKDVEISFEYNAESRGNSYNNFSIQQTAWIKFSRIGQGISYLYMHELIDNFSNLLSICATRYISPAKIIVSTEEDKKIELIYISENNEVLNEDLKSHDFIFRYVDIESDLQSFLDTWTNKYELLEPVIDYFVESHKKEVFTPISFLKLVQSLETFSRRIRPNWVEDQTNYNTKIEQILEDICEVENKDWLREKLRYSNEPTLATRLKLLFKEINFLLGLNSKKISSFSFKITETRNYYTHFDVSKKDKSLDIHEMFYFGRLFILMLRALILKELGFNQVFIEEHVDQKHGLDIIKQELKF
ncbi:MULTISPECIES: HEPN domain-containing protein [Paenibacillus]|nr:MULTISPECIES: HEPN domain-containing protein [Paenibacillus]AUO06326.1 hypothetical protein C0638_07200 [Paenibacillus sp. lzh-N1]AZH27496.1 hypothetical protein EGM68_01025 [Paenibacillus sp. M-152]QDA26818.1 hypothetical protein FGY93_07685 [Paenibacillus polymyxa]RTZ30889.1 hypothetical protein EJ573_23030 [Paenibacillus polymyxa]